MCDVFSPSKRFKGSGAIRSSSNAPFRRLNENSELQRQRFAETPSDRGGVWKADGGEALAAEEAATAQRRTRAVGVEQRPCPGRIEEGEKEREVGGLIQIPEQLGEWWHHQLQHGPGMVLKNPGNSS